MPDSAIEIQSQFHQIRQDYLSRLPSRLEAIELCWNQLSVEWHLETLGTLHRLVHTLTGTSATFGLEALSQTARCLEQQLQRWIAANAPQNPPDAIEWQEGTAILLQLKQQAKRSSTFAKSTEAKLSTDAHTVSVKPSPEDRSDEISKKRLEIQSKIDSTKIDSTPFNKRLVFLVEEDESAAQKLTLQISYFGYEVRAFQQLNQLEQAIVQATPAAILINLTETTAVADLKHWCTIDQHCAVQPFIIFISTHDNLLARLQAVRAGGDAYFTKPINVNDLIDKLDQLIERSHLDPYRILIIEDDRELAEFHALTLQQAGMVTHLVTNPLGILQPLNEFKPDLILMDIYMPSCSGLELAAVIRQQTAYVSIPIVFLSTETDVNKQLAAMSLGGDDFLTKPIQPQHLISSVASRAQRSATLRAYMVRDSLTGLFNHTKLKEQLAIELKRAHRQNTPLAFAMIDIDHFKAVNDIYGHPTGDRVIKSLSRLLQQRLRQTDLIGRYGGEEFAVILVDTDAVSAVRVMNQIRQSFAQVQQRLEGTEFNATFSCGIAMSSTYKTPAQISKAADKALYEAKQAGRNRVILATED